MPGVSFGSRLCVRRRILLEQVGEIGTARDGHAALPQDALISASISPFTASRRLDGPVVGLPVNLLAADLVDGLLSKTGLSDGSRLQHVLGENQIAEQASQEADDLPLGTVVGFVPRHEISQEVVAEVSAGLADDGEEPARHVEKLGHRGDVEKLRVDRDERAGRRADRAERQEAELRRAVDDDDVVGGVDFGDRLGNAREEEVAALPSFREDLRRVVLELVKLEISGDEIEAGEVGRPDDLGERPALVVVADRAVECLVFLDVEFRLIAE